MEKIPDRKKPAISLFLQDSMKWAPVTNFPWSQAIGAMLGFALPILLGILSNRSKIGIIAAMGGFALSGEGIGKTIRKQISGSIYTIIAGTLAVLAGLLIAKQGEWSVFILPLTAAIAGILGGISRPMAKASTQFIVFAVIASNFKGAGANILGVTALFLMGSTWTVVICLAMRGLFIAIGIEKLPIVNVNDKESPTYTAKQLFRRWRQKMMHLSGWNYAIKLGMCLLAAEIFWWKWPDYYGYWVILTVAILVQRDHKKILTKTFQRFLGTLLGVIAASFILIWSPSVWYNIFMISLLALIRPILKEGNYTTYSISIVPLIIFLINQQRSPTPMILIDRLLATITGCLVSLIFGYWIWNRIPKNAPTIS
jgi:fusaric acid resistance family protein